MKTIEYGQKSLKEYTRDNILSGKMVASFQTNEIEGCTYFTTDTNLCKELHFSQFGGANSFYFIPLSLNIDANINKHFNNMLV